MGRSLRKWHKYLSLAVAFVWLLQALSGVALAIYRPAHDQMLGVSTGSADPAMIERAFAEIQRRFDSTPEEMFAGGFAPGRFDVLLHPHNGRQTRVIIDGTDGRLLASDLWDGPVLEMDLFHAMFVFHNTFFSGAIGKKFVSLSGLLLLLNIGMALTFSWPGRNRLKQALWPQRMPSGKARWYAWHRAVGLWLAVPATFVIAAATLMIWRGDIERGTGLVPPAPEISAATDDTGFIGLTEAINTGKSVYPDGEISVLVLPSLERPYYLVRLTRPDEIRSVLGTSIVYIDAEEGRLLQAWSPVDAHPTAFLIDSLYAIHIGDYAWNIGRLVTLLVGLWLAATIILGLLNWQAGKRLLRNRTRR